LRHWAIFKQYYTAIYKDNQILRIGPSVISTKVLFFCPTLMCNGAYLRDILQFLCKKCRAQLESCWKPMVFILWICKVLCVKYVKTFIFFWRLWITYRIKGVNFSVENIENFWKVKTKWVCLYTHRPKPFIKFGCTLCNVNKFSSTNNQFI
jgi:hypothetical protein